MRHRVYGKKLGRNKDERDVLFKSLVQSLFTYGTIQTSEAKAKAIKGLVDKIINLAKSKNTQRLIQSFLSNKLLQERLIKEIAPKMQNRVSGYTSLVRMGRRLGDDTMIVRMSLIGAEEMKPVEKESRIKNKELSKKAEDKQKSPKVIVSKNNPVKNSSISKKTIIKKGVKKLNS